MRLANGENSLHEVARPGQPKKIFHARPSALLTLPLDHARQDALVRGVCFEAKGADFASQLAGLAFELRKATSSGIFQPLAVRLVPAGQIEGWRNRLDAMALC